MNCFCIKTQHFVSCIPLSGFSVKAARSFLSCLSKKAGQFPLPVPQKKTRFPRIMGGPVFYFVFSSLLRPALLRHPLFLRPPAPLRQPLGGRFVNLHKECHMFLCNLAQQKIPDAEASGIWWARVDSNHRSIKQQIYSLSPLATREHALILFGRPVYLAGRLVYFTTGFAVCQQLF